MANSDVSSYDNQTIERCKDQIIKLLDLYLSTSAFPIEELYKPIVFVLYSIHKRIPLEFNTTTGRESIMPKYIRDFDMSSSIDQNEHSDVFRWALPDSYCGYNGDFPLSEVYNIVNDFDWLDLYELIYPSLIEHIIEKLSGSKSSSVFAQSKELSQFVCSILKSDGVQSLYNPFAGLCSYSVWMDEDIKYKGEELNYDAYYLAKLRLDAHKKNNSVIHHEDSIDMWPFFEDCDAVVATPPFGKIGNTNHREINVDLQYNTYEEFTIANIMKSASYENQLKTAIVVVPSSFLTSSKYHRLREHLCKEFAIESIIQLPKGVLFPQTNISTSLIILKPQDINVELYYVDASFCYDSKSHKLDNDKLFSVYSTKDVDFCKKINILQIIDFDYEINPILLDVLNVGSYEGEDRIASIGEMAKEIKGTKKSNCTNSKIFTLNQFADNLLDLSNGRGPSGFTENEGVEFNGKCLLVSQNKGQLVCFWHKKDAPIIVGRDCLAISINESIVNPYFLAQFFFTNPIVRKVLIEERVSGKLSFDKISKLKLAIGDLAHQESFVNNILKKQKQQRESEINAEKARLGIRETTSGINHMLGRPFQNQQNIIGFLKEHQPTDNKYVDAVDALIDVSNFIRRIITSVGGDFSKEKNQEKEVALTSFVDDYIKAWNNFAVKDFKLLVEDNIGPDTIVSIDTDTMMILFDAVLDNAWRHGFKGNRHENNEVCIVLSAVERDKTVFADIQFCNNGLAMESSMSMEEFVSKGRFGKETGRTGLGGNHIYEIIKKHDGYLTIYNGEKWNFILELLLPIQNYDENLSIESLPLNRIFI